MGINIIFKLGFSRAFDETVNVDTENSMCTEYCRRVLAFFFRGNQKKWFHQVQVVHVVMPNSIFLTSVE